MNQAPGERMEDESAKSRDFRMGAMDVKIPPRTEFERFAKIKPWSLMKAAVEKKYPGYTIPSSADLEALHLEGEDKQKRLGAEGLGLPDGQVTIFTMDGDEPNRIQYMVQDGSYTKQTVSSEYETDVKRDLSERDFAGFFLVKKSQQAHAPEGMRNAA